MTILRSIQHSGNDHHYEICVTQDGITACGFAATMHDVAKKERELKQRVRRMAYQAMIENAASSV
jgi:hypothetical protein